MGDQDKEKNVEDPEVVQKSKGHVPRTWPFITKPLALTRVGYADGSNRTMDWAVGINGWTCPKRHELPKVVSDPYGPVYDLLSQDMVHGLPKPRKSRMVRSELRMVLVKPRSREGSVSERLCNVWLDDARDELVIVYETVKKLCIGSHVSK
ncbi:hypothetical protein YC2023_009641 [Brassica napus]